MHILIDPEEFTDPKTWDWNKILGFANGINQDGAKVVDCDVYDLGDLAERQALKRG